MATDPSSNKSDDQEQTQGFDPVAEAVEREEAAEAEVVKQAKQAKSDKD